MTSMCLNELERTAAPGGHRYAFVSVKQDTLAGTWESNQPISW
jgi:hypothetical protein